MTTTAEFTPPQRPKSPGYALALRLHPATRLPLAGIGTCAGCTHFAITQKSKKSTVYQSCAKTTVPTQVEPTWPSCAAYVAREVAK